MAVKLINKKQNNVTKIKLVSKNSSNVTIAENTTNPSMIIYNSGKLLELELLPLNNKYKGVQGTNKIFSNNSFETKALGESLYTNSNVITGGSTPFTIEFYALVSDLQNYTNSYNDYSLLSKVNTSAVYQGIAISRTNKMMVLHRGFDSTFTAQGTSKIQFNEINKFTLSYDGACLRLFVNDVLDIIQGIGTGLSITSEPLKLLAYIFSSEINTTKGIIDNINIFDGVATKVRDYDPYEENLVIDLSFDGENNSTKIIDNGLLHEKNKIPYFDNYNCLLEFKNDTLDNSIGTYVLNYNFNPSYSSVTLPFGEAKSLYLNNNFIYTDKELFNFGVEDFTIDFFIKAPTTATKTWPYIFASSP